MEKTEKTKPPRLEIRFYVTRKQIERVRQRAEDEGIPMATLARAALFARLRTKLR